MSNNFTIYDLGYAYEMIPLPMSAAEKFNEAVFFRNCMRESVGNTKAFPFYLSAFLTALKSVKDHLYKQYDNSGHHTLFSPWITRKLEEFRKDEVLSNLFGLRDHSVHHGPIIDKVYIRSHLALPHNGITTTEVKFTHTTDPSGQVKSTYKVGNDGAEVNTACLTEWIFRLPHKEVEVFTACDHAIEALRGALVEWDEKLNGTSRRSQ